ncbi:hypothetical protein EV714DRAFT_273071 [Schizophyllum commune]
MSTRTEGCTRDPDLWFDDGNLVIQVTPRLFRVHRGVLALSSTFFRDMINFPKAQEQDTYEDVPLIVLHDDDARDAAHFLKALYIPFSRSLKGVPALRRCALEHLATVFATGAGDLSTRKYIDELFDFLPDNCDLPLLKAVIALAREVGAVWLLPLAYYDTLTHDVANLDIAQELLGRQRNITRANFSACLRGRTLVDNCSFEKLRSFTADDLPGYFKEPLTYFTSWISKGDNNKKICEKCQLDMRRDYDTWLANVWETLPTLFNLPGWKDLLKLKRQDLGLGAPAPNDSGDNVEMDQD